MYYENLDDYEYIYETSSDRIRSLLDIIMDIIDKIRDFILSFFFNVVKSVKKRRNQLRKSYDKSTVTVNVGLFDHVIEILNNINSYMITMNNVVDETEREMLSSKINPKEVFLQKLFGNTNNDIKSTILYRVKFNTIKNFIDNPQKKNLDKTVCLEKINQLLSVCKGIEKVARSINKHKGIILRDIKRYGESCAPAIRSLLSIFKSTISITMSIYRQTVAIGLRSL